MIERELSAVALLVVSPMCNVVGVLSTVSAYCLLSAARAAFCSPWLLPPIGLVAPSRDAEVYGQPLCGMRHHECNPPNAPSFTACEEVMVPASSCCRAAVLSYE